MATLTISTKVMSEKRKEFLQAIQSIHDEIKAEKGIRSATLQQDDKDQNKLILTIEWETDEDLKNHLNGESFTVLVGALKILCLQAECEYKMGNRNGWGIIKIL